MEKQAKYYRARVEVINYLLGVEVEKNNGIIPREKNSNYSLLRSSAHIPKEYNLDDYIPKFIDTVSNEPLSFTELTSWNTWFAMHPEKVCGTEVITTSINFPIRIDGTKQDIIDTIGKTLNNNEVSEQNELKEIDWTKLNYISLEQFNTLSSNELKNYILEFAIKKDIKLDEKILSKYPEYRIQKKTIKDWNKLIENELKGYVYEFKTYDYNYNTLSFSGFIHGFKSFEEKQKIINNLCKLGFFKDNKNDFSKQFSILLFKFNVLDSKFNKLKLKLLQITQNKNFKVEENKIPEISENAFVNEIVFNQGQKFYLIGKIDMPKEIIINENVFNDSDYINATDLKNGLRFSIDVEMLKEQYSKSKNGKTYYQVTQNKNLSGMENNEFEIVGEISNEIANQIAISAGKIIIENGNDQWGYIHMQKHSKEYNKILMSVLDYIKFVCANFNQIRIDNDVKTNENIILVYKNGYAKVMYIQLKKIEDSDFWSISSGFPKLYSRIEKKSKLLWERIAPVSS